MHESVTVLVKMLIAIVLVEKSLGQINVRLLILHMEINQNTTPLSDMKRNQVTAQILTNQLI